MAEQLGEEPDEVAVERALDSAMRRRTMLLNTLRDDLESLAARKIAEEILPPDSPRTLPRKPFGEINPDWE